jgi:hypothetical protein
MNPLTLTEQRAALGLREAIDSPAPASDLTAPDREAPVGEVPNLAVEKVLRRRRCFFMGALAV